MTSESKTPDTGLDDLLNRHFAGKVVRKDLTKLVKEGANVPVYVLEYLLGNYCASNDEAVIEDGMRTQGNRIKRPCRLFARPVDFVKWAADDAPESEPPTRR